MAYKRHSVSRRSSRKSFRRGASFTHKRNFSVGPMRGGIRA